jgi:hypothetical protein
MKTFVITICLFLGTVGAASADPGKCQSTTNPKCFVGGLLGAPAPEIGSGASTALVIGGVLLGAMFLRHRRQT